MARLPTPGGDDGDWGDILNDFLGQAHNGNGSLKPSSIIAGGAEMLVNKNVPGGYAGLDSYSKLVTSVIRNGISQQLAIIYEPCDLLATVNDLNQFGYYVYDNGASGVNATITGPTNGHLIASGTPVSTGQRIAVHSTNIYGSTTDSGIYVVTNTGNGSSQYVLTRADDANTAATLGIFFAAQIKSDKSTLYFMPEATPFVVGTTHITIAIETLGARAEAGGSATQQFSHAEGQSTASGYSSHSEGTGTAAGDTSHSESAATALGDFAHAESAGYAAGDYAHAEGNATASGNYAHAESFGTATGVGSHAEGNGQAYANGMHAEGGGPGNIGQYSRTTRAVFTADATPTLLSDNNSQNGFILPDYYRGAIVRVRLIARRTTGGTISAWSADCMIDGDNSGSFRFVGSPAFTLIGQDVAASAWTVADIAFNGGDPHQLDIQVTGEAGVTIVWSATIELDEVV